MLNTYRIRIKSNSTYVGRLKSNTFFGAFCCAFKSLYGEDDLVHLLHQISRGEQDLTFSHAFKSGYLPQRMDKGTNLLVSLSTFGNECEEIISSIPKKITVAKACTREETKVYTIEQSIEDYSLDVYVATTLSKNKVKQVFDLALSTGIGSRKSTGNGIFRLLDMNEVAFSTEGCNGFIVLGDFIPDSETPTDCIVDIEIRDAITTSNKKQTSLMMFKCGSLFKGVKDFKQTYGQVIYDESSNSYINCKTIAYPVAI